MNHGYVHDIADINGWDEKTKSEEWRWKWLNPENLRNTTNDMGLWDAALEVIKLVPCEKKRRALWAWAMSEAGGKAFSKWCREEEGISRQAGDWRKNSAIECIGRAFARKPLQHNENHDVDHLPNHPEIEDKKSNIGVWRADDARPILGFDANLQDFSWSEAQNARRRERHARKREAA
ncbi:hypothetical protein [Agrobacterium larrymoorei]|uniref:hypothetical protein n=1 Tax=Agrobacterium larrymoorei TaxID=160699 RepID=UPI0030C2C0A5